MCTLDPQNIDQMYTQSSSMHQVYSLKYTPCACPAPSAHEVNTQPPNPNQVHAQIPDTHQVHLSLIVHTRCSSRPPEQARPFGPPGPPCSPCHFFFPPPHPCLPPVFLQEAQGLAKPACFWSVQAEIGQVQGQWLLWHGRSMLHVSGLGFLQAQLSLCFIHSFASGSGPL